MSTPRNASTDSTRPKDAAPPAAPGDDASGLAEELKRLQEEAGDQPVTVAKLIERLSDRGPAAAILLMSAPFVVIPIPGLSTAVGLAVFGLSLAVVIGGRPWMPGFVGRRQISPDNLRRLANGTERVLGWFRKLVKPRMNWLCVGPNRRLAGVTLLAGTIAFALPLPIPGNNIPPAIGMVLLSLGLVQRDGLLVLVGHVYTWLMWAVFVVLGIVFWNVVASQAGEIWGKVAGLLGM